MQWCLCASQRHLCENGVRGLNWGRSFTCTPHCTATWWTTGISPFCLSCSHLAYRAMPLKNTHSPSKQSWCSISMFSWSPCWLQWGSTLYIPWTLRWKHGNRWERERHTPFMKIFVWVSMCIVWPKVCGHLPNHTRMCLLNIPFQIQYPLSVVIISPLLGRLSIKLWKVVCVMIQPQ